MTVGSEEKSREMRPIDDNHYLTVPNERISVYVCVDKLPYLWVFQDSPDGSRWEDKTLQGKCEERWNEFENA